MDHDKLTLRLGATAILCALVLRLGAGGFFQPVARFLAQPNMVSLLIYLETGRIVRFSDSPDTSTVFVPEDPDPTLPPATEPEPALPVFAAAEAASVTIRGVEAAADPGSLLAQPLDWDLTGEDPTVLIYHSHATESYTRSPGERYQESSAFRTLSTDYNMVSIGGRVASLLEEGGVTVIHDTQLHDSPPTTIPTSIPGPVSRITWRNILPSSWCWTSTGTLPGTTKTR